MADSTDSADMSRLVKQFLSTEDDIRNISQTARMMRKTRVEQATSVMQRMADSGLTVIRVLHHEGGPRDVSLIKQQKRRSLTRKALDQALASRAGETIDEDVKNSILTELTAPLDEERSVLKISKVAAE